MNGGRITFENYKGILYCNASLNDEFTLSDLESMRREIREHYSAHTDIIYKRSGRYSIALDAQTILWEGIPEFRNFIYVIDDKSKENAVRYAVETYMRKYNTRVASTKEEAYAMLTEST
jgi:hypothetical protein